MKVIKLSQCVLQHCRGNLGMLINISHSEIYIELHLVDLFLGILIKGRESALIDCFTDLLFNYSISAVSVLGYVSVLGLCGSLSFKHLSFELLFKLYFIIGKGCLKLKVRSIEFCREPFIMVLLGVKLRYFLLCDILIAQLGHFYIECLSVRSCKGYLLGDYRLSLQKCQSLSLGLSADIYTVYIGIVKEGIFIGIHSRQIEYSSSADKKHYKGRKNKYRCLAFFPCLLF